MEWISARGKRVYKGEQPFLLRGFGLGGWLLPEGYMWRFYTKCDRPRRMEALIQDLCGPSYAAAFWSHYAASYITEKDIALVRQHGFNSVRLPMNARHLADWDGAGPIWNEETFGLIDKLITWCRAHSLYVILDMHGAPGGQTGQNIDDSERDEPGLFQDDTNVEKLAMLWCEIAWRYRDEPTVAGYDLLNEPLPKWHNRYNNALLPLYRRLIRDIRGIDHKHMIILEGAHWATDFSVFEGWQPEPGEENLLLQFHKYWSNPDAESLEPFLAAREKLDMPLFMGEGGENNLDWYAAIFPLYENLDISWNFWSYKKMDCTNSPVTFRQPDGWQELIAYLDGGEKPGKQRAWQIFDDFLASIAAPIVREDVFRAVSRTAPVRIQAEWFDTCGVCHQRGEGALVRIGSPADIQFVNGNTGVVDYKRYGGEEQPEGMDLCVLLNAGEWLEYWFLAPREGKIGINVTCLQGAVGLQVDGKPYTIGERLAAGRHTLRVTSEKDETMANTITITLDEE